MLFRTINKISNGKKHDHLINLHLSHKIIGIFSFLLVCTIFSVLFFFDYTKKVTVYGQLKNKNGTISVVTRNPGIIKKVYVKNGQYVEKGDPLVEINDDTLLAENLSLSSVKLDRIEQEIESIDIEVDKLKHGNKVESEISFTKLSLLNKEVDVFERQYSMMKERLEITKEKLKIYETLSGKNYISKMQLLNEKDAYRALNSSLLDLENKISSTRSTIIERNLSNRSRIIDYESDIEKYKRLRIDASLRLSDLILSNMEVVRSPVSGIIYNFDISLGNKVGGQILLNVVPTGSDLEAHLYISDSIISNIDAEQEVQLRYNAYPYQDHGSFLGVINYVSAAPMFNGDERELSFINNKHGSYYKAIASVVNDDVINLSPGMTFEASVSLKTKKLYQWLM
ncbi:HlyD family secretion protein [Enterovibrio norvegicus]|uniref:HlyD family secretion protein n=1 Tax=Enterovibrio norvegicus TaxID=188144 RepID=UPI003551A678